MADASSAPIPGHHERFADGLREIEQEIVDAQLLGYLALRLDDGANPELSRWAPSLRRMEQRARRRIADLRERLRCVAQE